MSGSASAPATKKKTKKRRRRDSVRVSGLCQSIYTEEYPRTKEWFVGLRPSVIATPKKPEGNDEPFMFRPPGQMIGGVQFVCTGNPLERVDAKRLRSSVTRPGHYQPLTFDQVQAILNELPHRVTTVQVSNQMEDWGHESLPTFARGKRPLDEKDQRWIVDEDVPYSMFAVLLPRGHEGCPMDSSLDYRNYAGEFSPTIAELEPSLLQATVDEHEFDPDRCPWLPWQPDLKTE